MELYDLICRCCGEKDMVEPCQDCIAYCPTNELCKAQGIALLRIKLADIIQNIVFWVDPRQ